jgi:hypothetical protein
MTVSQSSNLKIIAWGFYQISSTSIVNLETFFFQLKFILSDNLGSVGVHIVKGKYVRACRSYRRNKRCLQIFSGKS